MGHKGYGLLEILVALGLMGVVMTGMMSLTHFFNQSVGTARVASNADRLLTQVHRVAATPIHLKYSATRNPSSMWGRCVLGGGGCDASTWHDLELFTAPPVVTPGVTGTRIAGTMTSPAMYAVDGAGCSAPGSICPLRATARFRPLCTGPSPCPQANAVEIIVEVSQSPGTRILASSSQLAIRRSKTPISMAVSEINDPGAKGCPPNTNYQGQDPYGKPICAAPNVGAGVCNFPYVFREVRMSNNQLVTACVILPAGAPCPVGQVMKGYNLQSNSPICVAARDLLPNNTIKCPPGKVMTGYNMWTQTAVCEVPQNRIYIAYGAANWFLDPSTAQGNPCRALAPQPNFVIYHYVGQANCNSGDIVTGGGGECQFTGGGTIMASKPTGGNAGWYVDCCVYAQASTPTQFPNVIYAMCQKNN